MSDNEGRLEDDLSLEEQEELFQLMLQEEGLLASSPRIERIEREGPLPVSFAQQRMWLLDQWQPGNPAYNIALPLEFHGDLERELLERCLDELVARHESLRTTFGMHEGQLFQVIGPIEKCPLAFEDLSGLPAPQRQAALRRSHREESLFAFDLSRGPLLRARLLRLSQQEHHLLLNLHHIIVDGWSLNVLVQELTTLYTAFAEGRPSPLPPLPIQYVDFAHWQRQWLQGERLERLLDYWRQQLAEVAPLELPTDHVRPPLQTFAGALQELTLPSALTSKIKALSQHQQVTLFMLLLTSFQLLLSRYSSQHDIAVGTPIANRTSEEIEQVVGCFVNTLVLRTDLSGNPTFLHLLQRVRQLAQQAYAQQDVPFEKLVEELHPQRDPSRSPLFQVMVTQQPASLPIRLLDYLTLKESAPKRYTAKFDLTLTIFDDEQDLQALLEYNTDLFEASTIQRLFAHWQRLLEAIVADPGQHVSEISLLSEAEQEQMLRAWNATEAEVPTGLLHQVFEAQVERTPDNVALICEGKRLTYRELNQQANQLARYLQKQGLTPGEHVGICIDRSFEMVIGLLGILKAGGVYVPLDPNYPAERLTFMLEDAQIAVLLTRQSLSGLIPSHSTSVICLDRAWLSIARESQANLVSSAQGDDCAYMIYTSGSTGKPKGVLGTHRASLNRFNWMWRTYPFGVDEICCQKTTLSFVDAVWEIFGPLLRGIRQVIIPDPVVKDPAQLLQILAEEKVTRIVLVPSLLRVLLEEGGSDLPKRIPALKYWICSGEALSVDLAQLFYQRVRGGRLINLYGSSEVAADATYYEVQPGQPLDRVPIGRPIDNMKVYVLDQAMQPVPPGVPGELYIGGAGLARGYFNRPELTRAKFVADPFSGEPGARLYKTGDRGRYLSDGTLEYLGRLDTQVKLRGFRIELGEIEATLLQHPGVREGAVLLREDAPGEKRLVAYLVAEQQAALTDKDLRAFLKQTLPDYMLPAAYVALERLPLTPNGKLDRMKLLGLGPAGLEHANVYVAPRNLVEEKLAEIWKQVLRRARVGIYDNFFELGGDSLLGVRMVALARAAGLQLTSQQLFRHQTIAELATVVDAASPILAEQGTVVGTLPLTPLQTWYLAEAWHNPHRWTMASLIEVARPLEHNLLRQALQHLLRHHDGLRMYFVQEQGQWHAVIAAPGEQVPLDLVDLSDYPEQEQQTMIESQARRFRERLDLFAGPALRVVYFKRGPQNLPQLLLVCHHIIFDAYSQMIFLTDLQSIYQQLERGEPVRLPTKTTSLKQWGERLAEYVASDELRHEFETYWRTLPWDRIIPLPVDFHEGRKEDTRGGAQHVIATLSQEETTVLLTQVVSADTTILDVLLTALMRSFVPWIGNYPLYLDIVEMGREPLFDEVDLSNTVGQMAIGRWLLLSLSEEGSLEEALHSIKTQVRAAPNRGIGQYLLTFLSKDPLIREVIDEIPLPEVLFNYMGQTDIASAGTTNTDALLTRPIEADLGPHWDPREMRDRSLHFALGISNGQFWIFCEYGQKVYQQATISALVDRYVETLRALMLAATTLSCI